MKYLLDLGADTEVADVGAQFVWTRSLGLSIAYAFHSKPADLAILKSLADDATNVEREIVEVFSQRDDYVQDFEFTPIHIAVLHLYDVEDRERPSLEKYVILCLVLLIPYSKST